MKRRSAAALIVVAVLGCQERAPVVGPPALTPAPSPQQRVAFLSVSNLWPAAGDTIVVSGIVGVDDSMSVASFRVRLGYNRRLLRFVDEVPLPGMLRVVNPQPDMVIVAGASSNASTDGRLFALRFHVADAAGLESLSLGVDELNDERFISQLPALKRSSRLELEPRIVTGARREAGAFSGGLPIGAPPRLDSITPGSARVDAEGVTDLVLYGQGFAATGNTVLFDGASIDSVGSEAGGSIIRFAAPTLFPARGSGQARRVVPGSVLVRVRTRSGTSNAVQFIVRGERQ